jgi:hypothetical protein
MLRRQRALDAVGYPYVAVSGSETYCLADQGGAVGEAPAFGYC